ncbi:hypothetical protein GRF29_213g1069218, partial [Pseudopithomyces chartarum]
IFTIGLTAAVLLANQTFGWDRHIYDIPMSKWGANLKIAMAAKLLFTAAATFTRLSLFTFYYRLVKDSSRQGFRWMVHLNVAYTVAIFFTFIFLGTFLCTPVHLYWTIGAEGKCLDEGAATMAAGIINVTADFLCTITPMPLVAQLSMPRRQRAAVMFLFSLGFLVTIVGCVRTWYIYKALVLEYDLTWYSYPLWIAAAIEIDVGVICASAPVLRPLLSKFLLYASSHDPTSTSRHRRKGYSAQTLTAVNSSLNPNPSPSHPNDSYPPHAPHDPKSSPSSPVFELRAWTERTKEEDEGSEEAIMRGRGDLGPPPECKHPLTKSPTPSDTLRTPHFTPTSNPSISIYR